MKDSLYWGAGWAWDDTPEAYQPYLSPLMYHKGMVRLQLLPVLLPVILQRYPVILYPLIILFTTQHRRVLLLPESLP